MPFFPRALVFAILASLSVTTLSVASSPPSFTSAFRISRLSFANGSALPIPAPTTLVFSPTHPNLVLIGTYIGTLHLVRLSRSVSPSGGAAIVARAVDDVLSLPGRTSVVGLGADPFRPRRFFVSVIPPGSGPFLAPSPDQLSGGRVLSVRLTGRFPNLRLRLSPDVVVDGLPTGGFFTGPYSVQVDAADGSLLIPQGAMTNGGVPAPKFGNVPETPTSGAVLRVGLLPGIARLASTACLFATGFRRPYSAVMTPDNRLVVLDLGADPAAGPKSTGCSMQQPFDTSQPNSFVVVRRARWYGHANRARAAQGECAFASAFRNATPPDNPRYAPPVLTDEDTSLARNSLNAIALYTHAWPGMGRARGRLFATEVERLDQEIDDVTRPRKLLRVTLRGPDRGFADFGNMAGAEVAVDAIGALISVSTSESVINVAVPARTEELPDFKHSATIVPRGVFPTRGPPGSWVFVTVSSMTSAKHRSVTVRVGDRPCSNGMWTTVGFGRGAQVWKCKVPAQKRYIGRAVTVSIGSRKLRKAFTVVNPSIRR